MTTVWVICGAGRGVGKTHLAQRLCAVLPDALYVKCGHGPAQSGKPGACGKPGAFVTSEAELERFLAEHAAAHEHVVVESNAFARRGQGDVIIYLDGSPAGTKRREDADLLAARAEAVVGDRPCPEAWRRKLRAKLGDGPLLEAVVGALLEQARYRRAGWKPAPRGGEMRPTDDMIPLEEALARLDAALAGVRLPAEMVPTRLAPGRVLAEGQRSRLDLPPFDKSAVDGYALPAGPEAERYTVRGTVAAGDAGPGPLAAGTAVKVMTGAPVPPGTERVVMVEDAEQTGETVLIRQRRGGANICRQAEDVRAGDLVLPAGTTLATLDVANLIACGITEVSAVRRPRLAIISTGEEIVDHVEDLAPGKIMNANGPLLAGLARDYGLEVVSEESYGDEPAALRAGVAAAEGADLVVLSGGVSAGDFDYVPRVLEELGWQIHFSRVAVKPGKPIVFATRGAQAALGLPGNPVSVYLTFHLFVRRAVARLTGAQAPLREVRLPLGEDFRRRHGERLEFVPARLTEEGRVAPVEFHGSAHLTALGAADGFFQVPLGVTALAAGEEVAFVPLLRRTP
jgi:molybdopterin molybdotransferase